MLADLLTQSTWNAIGEVIGLCLIALMVICVIMVIWAVSTGRIEA